MSNHCADFDARRVSPKNTDQERAAKLAKLQQRARRSATAAGLAKRSRPREEDPIDLIARAICKPTQAKRTRPPEPALVQPEVPLVPGKVGLVGRLRDELQHVRPSLWIAFLMSASAYGVMQAVTSLSL